MRARGLTKSFRIPRQRYSSVKERVLHPLRSPAYDVLAALHDVSFDVPRGEFLGVVGRNGSGKSTLMRCLAGIYRPDSGEVRAEGRVAPFIELGVGFNPELSARDNAVINAVMLGMTEREARSRLPAIFEFAELEDFAELKLLNYSSGMVVRLAFAVTIQVDADTFLFDEVLAVGDEAFQAKCHERFRRLKADGRTVVLVTHNMPLVERFCDRALLLESGRIEAVGEPAAIVDAYHRVNAA
jgi:ABC-type polysaccharide/polyol phosphate transport system ATPase subunit